MNKDVLVYISGPMTAKDGRTMEQNTADGVAVYLDLLKRGIPAFSPHLSGAFPSANAIYWRDAEIKRLNDVMAAAQRDVQETLAELKAWRDR